VTARATAAGDAPEAEPKKRFAPMSGRDIKGRDEQEKDARRYVESRGGTYVHTYEEPDTSAWKRKRVRQADGTIVYRVLRPVFEGALEDLKRGTTPEGQPVDGLIVYDIDRLTRDNRHLEDAIEVVENFHRPIIDITGTLDLLTDNGRTVARILVAAASKQSADTARRVKRKHDAMKKAGIPVGGSRPFGWQDDKRTLVPEEAKVIRKAVKRVLEGAPVRSICAEWNREGITTPRGNPWSRETVKHVLRNPRICGYRSQSVRVIDPLTGLENMRMEIVRDERGQPVGGLWEPLISVSEWEALTGLIGAAPARGDGHNARKYLGSGTLRCDKNGCGAAIRAVKARASDGAHPDGCFFYQCPSRGSGRGCGGVRIPGPETDKVIRKLVIAKYEEEATAREAQVAPSKWDKEEELLRLREDITDWTEQRKARSVTKERFFAFLSEAEATERRLLHERNEWQRKTRATGSKPIDLGKIWDDLDLVEQRAYVERVLTAVLVSPAIKRGGPVRERLTPLYRERF
jgi:site-specific DNA recombinase